MMEKKSSTMMDRGKLMRKENYLVAGYLFTVVAKCPNQIAADHGPPRPVGTNLALHRPCHSLQETPGQKGDPNPSASQSCLLIDVFRDVWRYQGMFSSWERFRPKHTFPGLGIGTGAFLVYLAYNLLLAKPSHGGHGGHGAMHG